METDRQRVERLMVETMEEILRDICREDNTPERAIAKGVEHMKRGLLVSLRKYPVNEDGIRAIAAGTDENIKAGCRMWIEPDIRKTLAALRPS